jgi:hypothetical protein
LDRQLFYNLLTRDALLIYNGVAHALDGPYDSRDEAERAAEELIKRLDEDEQNSEREHRGDMSGRTMFASRVKALFDIHVRA